MSTPSRPYHDHVGLWANQLAQWVPQKLFDAHVHLGTPEVVRPPHADRLTEALTTFTSLTHEQAQAWYQDLYAGKTILGQVAFGFPLREVNIGEANEYLAGLARRDLSLRPFILADPHDIGSTIRQFHCLRADGVRFLGVKPYYDLLGIEKKNSVFHCCDADFVPMELLEFMNAEQLVLMLHTSGIGVGDPKVRGFVSMVAQRFARIKIVLAHMGRYTKPEQFDSFFESEVLDYPNVFLDTSSATSDRVYARCLSRRDLWDRILFGSDLPYGLITGVEHWSDTHGPVFITRDRYRWSDEQLNQQFAHLRRQLSYNTYHVIQALKSAIDELGLAADEQETLKAKLFWQNALERLFG